MSRLAVVGGSGFAALRGFEEISRELPETPYGPPSAPVVRGRLNARELLFIPRHGVGHRFPPHRINYRSNLWALKHCGAQKIVGLAAVGGIGAAYGPGVLAVPDQIVDYTYGRAQTFFDGESAELVHIDFTRPYCEELRHALLAAGPAAGLQLVDGGTYGVTQGPRLETAAEVVRLERDGCHVVGMTGMPEAALARELGICYACCAFVVNWAVGKAAGEIQMSEIERNIELSSTRIQRLLAAVVEAI